jgi:hypothetical protein
MAFNHSKINPVALPILGNRKTRSQDQRYQQTEVFRHVHILKDFSTKKSRTAYGSFERNLTELKLRKEPQMDADEIKKNHVITVELRIE